MKTQSWAINPNVFTFTFFPLIKLYILFMMYWPKENNLRNALLKKTDRQTAFTFGPRDISIMKADLLLSPRGFSKIGGLGRKAGRWLEGECFEVKRAVVPLSSHPVSHSQPASSGY